MHVTLIDLNYKTMVEILMYLWILNKFFCYGLRIIFGYIRKTISYTYKYKLYQKLK